MFSKERIGPRMETSAFTGYSSKDFPFRTTLLLRKDEVRPNILLD